MSEHDGILQTLKKNDFERIQTDLQLKEPSRRRKISSDFVCWESRDGKTLEPLVVVCVADPKDPASLERLARLKDGFGSVDLYAVWDGAWYLANDAVMAFDESDPPENNWDTPPDAKVSDPVLIDHLVTQMAFSEAWNEAERHRSKLPGQVLVPEFIVDVARGVASAVQVGLNITVGVIKLNAVAALQKIPTLVELIIHRQGLANSGLLEQGLGTSAHIVEAMATLAGSKKLGKVIDPFFGLGSLVWSLLGEGQYPTEVYGGEIMSGLHVLASELSEISPVPITLFLGDTTQTLLAEDAELVITVPPFGMRMETTTELLNGQKTRDLELLCIDQALRSLNASGRLVVQLPITVLGRTMNKSYLDYLSNNHHVAAIIGLPEGTTPGTRIRSFILVIDKDERGETFVASLGDDWKEQLQPSSAMMSACVEHLESRREHA